MKIFKPHYQGVYCASLLFAGLTLTGCANMQSLDAAVQQNLPSQSLQPTPAAQAAPVHEKLMTVFANYEGTPYVYGGTNRNGFDCSGFINVAFNEAFNLNLPRTTDGIASSGKPIMRNQLTAGDIVFFKTSAKELHAGIYTKDGQFIHASTSKGVIASSLENAYWKNRYIAARRFL